MQKLQQFTCRTISWNLIICQQNSHVLDKTALHTGYGVGRRQYKAYSPLSLVWNLPRRLCSCCFGSCCSYSPGKVLEVNSQK